MTAAVESMPSVQSFDNDTGLRDVNGVETLSKKEDRTTTDGTAAVINHPFPPDSVSLGATGQSPSSSSNTSIPSKTITKPAINELRLEPTWRTKKRSESSSSSSNLQQQQPSLNGSSDAKKNKLNTSDRERVALMSSNNPSQQPNPTASAFPAPVNGSTSSIQSIRCVNTCNSILKRDHSFTPHQLVSAVAFGIICDGVFLSEIPVKHQPDSDLEDLLSKLKLGKATQKILMNAGLDLPGFLSMKGQDFEMIGIKPNEAHALENVIIEIHKIPWTKDSLTPLPQLDLSTNGAAGGNSNSTETNQACQQIDRFNVADLMSQVTNCTQHLRCMDSQFITAQRLVDSNNMSERAALGFDDRDNQKKLTEEMDKLLESCKALNSTVKQLEESVIGDGLNRNYDDNPAAVRRRSKLRMLGGVSAVTVALLGVSIAAFMIANKR